MSKKFTSLARSIGWRLEDWVRYRDIVWYRTLAGLKSEARQSFLGYVWFLLEPAITTAIMYTVYVLIFQSRNKDTVVLLLVGTIIWQWFESSVVVGMMGIKNKLHIMTHFTLPKYIFPLVGIFTNTWKFLCVYGAFDFLRGLRLPAELAFSLAAADHGRPACAHHRVGAAAGHCRGVFQRSDDRDQFHLPAFDVLIGRLFHREHCAGGGAAAFLQQPDGRVDRVLPLRHHVAAGAEFRVPPLRPRLRPDPLRHRTGLEPVY
jgi:hypothetical protein